MIILWKIIIIIFLFLGTDPINEPKLQQKCKIRGEDILTVCSLKAWGHSTQHCSNERTNGRRTKNENQAQAWMLVEDKGKGRFARGLGNLRVTTVKGPQTIIKTRV